MDLYSIKFIDREGNIWWWDQELMDWVSKLTYRCLHVDKGVALETTRDEENNTILVKWDLTLKEETDIGK